RATLAMMVTPDGQGTELNKFHTPNAITFGPMDAPVNALGIRRIMFAVDDLDVVVAHMLAHRAELIGEMQYEDTYRLAYIRGPEGIIVGLAEQLGQGVSGVPATASVTDVLTAPLSHSMLNVARWMLNVGCSMFKSS